MKKLAIIKKMWLAVIMAIVILLCSFLSFACGTTDTPHGSGAGIGTGVGNDEGEDEKDKDSDEENEPEHGGQDNVGTNKTSVLSYAKDLANKIDKLPGVNSVLNLDTTTKMQSAKNSAQRETEVLSVTDMTSPSDQYYDLTVLPAMFTEKMKSIEMRIRNFKERKDEALKSVSQFDVWVNVSTIPGISDCYRLKYDINLDCVTIEETTKGDDSDSNTIREYRYMKCFYNDSGKLVIIGKQIVKGRLFEELTVNYVEGEEWKCSWAYTVFVTSKFEGMTLEYESIHRCVIESDLTTKNAVIVEYSAAENEYYSNIHVTTNTLWQEGDIPVVVCNEYQNNNFFYSGLQYESRNYYTYIIGQNGQAAIRLQPNQARTPIEFALYNTSGWDKFYVYENEDEYGEYSSFELKVGDMSYKTGQPEYHFDNIKNEIVNMRELDESYDYNNIFNWGLATSHLFSGGLQPVLRIMDIDLEANYIEAIRALFDSCALSVDEAYINLIRKYYEGYIDVLSSIVACGYKNYSDITEDEFICIYDSINIKMSDEEFDNVFKEPTISKDSQIEDSEILNLLEIVVDGEIELNLETGELDLSNISATVLDSLLLSESAKYSLVIALKGYTELIEICNVSSTYCGENMYFNGFESADIKDLVGYDDYTVVAYLTIKDSDSINKRKSQYYLLKCTEESEYIETHQETIETENGYTTFDYTYSISASENDIIVANYYLVTLTPHHTNAE